MEKKISDEANESRWRWQNRRNAEKKTRWIKEKIKKKENLRWFWLCFAIVAIVAFCKNSNKFFSANHKPSKLDWCEWYWKVSGNKRSIRIVNRLPEEREVIDGSRERETEVEVELLLRRVYVESYSICNEMLTWYI